jgi:alpha-tubulin suppressor-like RCC1 family protein
LGFRHSCALIDGGEVRCWGQPENRSRNYGRKSSDEATAASVGLVELGSKALQITAGGHSCALLDSGKIRCWGNGFEAHEDLPVEGRVVQLSAGARHVCALLQSGRVRCWGDSLYGQLGYGSRRSVAFDQPPADVDVGGEALQVAAGWGQTCALLKPANVRCWGNEPLPDGPLKSLDQRFSALPASAYGLVRIGGPVVQLAVGGSNCALLAQGTVRCWGDNRSGQLGYGHRNDVEIPEVSGDVRVGGKVTQIAVGLAHVCALLEGGRVRCWGNASDGALGYGNGIDIGDDETPESAGDVPIGENVVQIAVGSSHTCALLESGRVRCWGEGRYGQLGYGITERIGDDETPAEVAAVQVLPGDVATAPARPRSRVEKSDSTAVAASPPLLWRDFRQRPPSTRECEPSCPGCRTLFDASMLRRSKPRSLNESERLLLRRAYTQYLKSPARAAYDAKPMMDPAAIGTAQDDGHIADVLDGSFSAPRRAQTLILFSFRKPRAAVFPSREEGLVVLIEGQQILGTVVGTRDDRLFAVDLEGDGTTEVMALGSNTQSTDSDSTWIDLRSYQAGVERMIGRFSVDDNSCGSSWGNQHWSYHTSYRFSAKEGALCFLSRPRALGCRAVSRP